MSGKRVREKGNAIVVGIGLKVIICISLAVAVLFLIGILLLKHLKPEAEFESRVLP